MQNPDGRPARFAYPFDMWTRTRAVAVLAGLVLAASPTFGWDAATHRNIAIAALDRLGGEASFPAWLKEARSKDMIGYEAAEPDRWRATRTPSLKHENDPDHYIDLEDLTAFGLTLETLPRLRYEYVKEMVLYRQQHPELAGSYNPRTDTARTLEYPGYLPHAIMEHYEKLRASFYNLRVLEMLNDPARADHVAMARQNVMVQMGLLAHFVGDASQPLHSTRHHHGWVGENPAGYTTARTIHAQIDSIPPVLGVDDAAIRAMPGELPTLENDPWPQVLAEVQRGFDKVEPLYQLEKAGALHGEQGRAFIAERVLDATTMLAALYKQAWELSAPTEKDVADFLKYDMPAPRLAPGTAPAPMP